MTGAETMSAGATPPVSPGASQALSGRERVTIDRPEWAASIPPEHRPPLPGLTAEALVQPAAPATNERLRILHHDRHDGGWSPEMGRLREQAAVIRRETLADLETHLARLTERIEAHGGVVHRVQGPAEGRAVIGRLAAERGVRMVVKSKSMATEEMHLNRHLEEQGIDVVETDLGEYIVQLADERPSHIVAPAAHKSEADVRRIFEELGGDPLPGDRTHLAAFARARLREDFHRADMGITGVNFAAADTGTLTIVTNEGNARMVTSQPRVHVAVMTVEKVIARLTDLAVLLPLLSHAAAKQDISVYQTMITGPRRPGEVDGPEELHVVIMDNGRTSLLGGRYEEVLACIRCGACQVACPVYRTLGGGHAYGAVYGGPIGAVLTPLLTDVAGGTDLPFLSSLCGNCYDVCPVKIPLPDMLVDLRADHEAAEARPSTRLAWRAWAWAWRSPAGFSLTARAARLAGRLPERWLQALPSPTAKWAKGRELPPLGEAGAFRRWWGGRK